MALTMCNMPDTILSALVIWIYLTFITTQELGASTIPYYRWRNWIRKVKQVPGGYSIWKSETKFECRQYDCGAQAPLRESSLWSIALPKDLLLSDKISSKLTLLMAVFLLWHVAQSHNCGSYNIDLKSIGWNKLIWLSQRADDHLRAFYWRLYVLSFIWIRMISKGWYTHKF